MDNEEARNILSDQLQKYKLKKYVDLLYLLKSQDTFEIVGQSGTRYQLEFQAFYDDKKSGHVRVCGAIDDRGWQAFVPLTNDFIITPDGTFIGEY